jgi:hypothetical protein
MQCACPVLFCHLRPACFYSIFPHYLINSTILEKKLLNIKCIFLFSLQRLSASFLIQRRTERDMTKNVYCSSCKLPDTLVRLKWILKFLDRLFKNTDIFHENTPSGSAAVRFRTVPNRKQNFTNTLCSFLSAIIKIAKPPNRHNNHNNNNTQPRLTPRGSLLEYCVDSRHLAAHRATTSSSRATFKFRLSLGPPS